MILTELSIIMWCLGLTVAVSYALARQMQLIEEINILRERNNKGEKQ